MLDDDLVKPTQAKRHIELYPRLGLKIVAVMAILAAIPFLNVVLLTPVWLIFLFAPFAIERDPKSPYGPYSPPLGVTSEGWLLIFSVTLVPPAILMLVALRGDRERKLAALNFSVAWVGTAIVVAVLYLIIRETGAYSSMD